jgi:hypothetical protein
MEILRFNPAKQDGSFQGSVNMRMKIRYMASENEWIEDVFTINKIKIYKNKYGKKFISLPSEAYDKDGEKKYFPYNHFGGKDKFEYALLKNLDNYQQVTQENKQTQDAQQEDVPF